MTGGEPTARDGHEPTFPEVLGDLHAKVDEDHKGEEPRPKRKGHGHEDEASGPVSRAQMDERCVLILILIRMPGLMVVMVVASLLIMVALFLLLFRHVSVK